MLHLGPGLSLGAVSLGTEAVTTQPDAFSPAWAGDLQPWRLPSGRQGLAPSPASLQTVQERGFYPICQFGSNGRLVHCVEKESDVGYELGGEECSGIDK